MANSGCNIMLLILIMIKNAKPLISFYLHA